MASVDDYDYTGLEELRRVMKTSIKIFSGQDLNPEPPRNEMQMIITQPRLLVIIFLILNSKPV